MRDFRRTQRRTQRRSHRRTLGCERLEARRLMIAEGDLFELSTNLSSAGLVGTTSAVIRWGDGSESPAATVTGGDATGPLRIRFDYSLDTGNFFGGANQSRRALLQTAADAVIGKFADDLAAISPAGKAEWIPSVFHPSSGPANQPAGTLVSLTRNLVVASNEIIVYVGARDLPGNRVGVGGTGSYTFPAVTLDSDAERQQINAFRDIVAGRGEPGALTSPQTDLGPWGGSISFDNQTDWYFGNDPGGIDENQLDFISIASHEIAHVLGFGINRTDAITSWDRLASSTDFSGPKARAAYRGGGNVPLQNDHWSATVLDQFSQPTLMSQEISRGTRQLFTELDFAAMDDIGWDVLSTATTVTANHRFADDGSYPVQVVLRGSRSGEIVHELSSVNVTNVTPTLVVQSISTAVVGQAISITDLGSIVDPGFANDLAQPPTGETFGYTINWGDGSPIDSGSATIDSRGNASGSKTLASFDAQHQYTQSGTFTVAVGVTDDDGGAAQGSFLITVPPHFQNPVDRFDVNNDGRASALDALRVINELARRGGPVMLVIENEAPNASVFVDVNGDYRLSALDALQVINELARRLNRPPAGNLSQVAGDSPITPELPQPIDGLPSDDDDQTVAAIWWIAAKSSGDS